MIPLKLTIMALLWAGGFIVAKVISPMAGPFTITCLRFSFVTVLMAAIVAREGKQPPIRPIHWAYAVGTGLFGVLCYNYCFMAGVRLIDAGRGAVIISTVPIAVAVFSYLFLKEKMGRVKALGLAVSVAGAWIVVSHGKLEVVTGLGIGLGEFYLLMCVLCAALFALFSKELLKEFSPSMTMALVSGPGAVLALLPTIAELRQMPIPWDSWTFLAGVAYMAIGPSVIAVIFYYQAMKVIGPTKASQYMNLIPVFAVVFGMVFLGEQLTPSLFVGGGLVTAGLYLAHSKV
jgi:drug/metabolite transporter (DMT)-like permease